MTTDIPAGWYDDPEHPDQHRYWDGTQWTEHRAQKSAAPLAGADASAWQVVPDAFALVSRCWRTLVIVALAPLLITIAGVITIYLAFDAALEPGVGEIIDRVTDPDFDPDRNPADDAFVDSIRIDAGVGTIVAWIFGAIATVLGAVVSPIVMTCHLASAKVGRPLTPADSLRAALARLPRILGILLLWGMGAVFVAAVWTVVTVILAGTAPLALLIIIPAAFAAVVFLWPYVQMAFPVLVIAPRDRPPLRSTITLIRTRWVAFAVRLLVLNLTLLAVSFGINMISSPLALASVWAGLIGGLVAQSLQTALLASGGVVIYDWAGGAIDPALQAPNTAPDKLS